MAGETEVTIATARFIGAKDWRVISIALPRGGSGLSFPPDDDQNPTIIPDIVAVNRSHSKYIFVEAKPMYSTADVQKLLSVRKGDYSKAISATLQCASRQVLLGAAFAGRIPTLDFKNLGLEFVFHYDEQDKIVLLHEAFKLGI